MRPFLLALLLLPLAALAQDVRLAVGMNRDEVLSALKKHGARDMSPHLSIAANIFGPEPFVGVFWELKDYDAIVEVEAKEGKVASLTFWTKKSFNDKGLQRGNEQSIKALKIDPAKKKVSIEE